MGEANRDFGKFGVVLEREDQRFVDTLSDVANHRMRTPHRVKPRLTSTPAERDEDSTSGEEEVASDTSLSPEY
ncbi:hypothetical protein ON010_g7053 [Phytophthora cinnamomi]|nr:hypothetical protein ON010_g7053 [Phytophthora cinnamomi]